MSGRKIYQRKEYSIYKAGYGYIVHNTNKEFKYGHTHCKNFYKAKRLIDLAINMKVPQKADKWEVESLVRISKNVEYIEKLKKEIK